jgi:hypothetical protein
MDLQILAAFNSGFRGQIREALKGLDEFWSVWISAVVERVHADEDVAGSKYLRPS